MATAIKAAAIATAEKRIAVVADQLIEGKGIGKGETIRKPKKKRREKKKKEGRALSVIYVCISTRTFLLFSLVPSCLPIVLSDPCLK